MSMKRVSVVLPALAFLVFIMIMITVMASVPVLMHATAILQLLCRPDQKAHPDDRRQHDQPYVQMVRIGLRVLHVVLVAHFHLTIMCKRLQLSLIHRAGLVVT